jgi:ribosomal protein L29
MRKRGEYRRGAALVLMALLLLIPLALSGQMRGRRGVSPAHPEAFKGIVVTFHGTLRKLSKKEIMIESTGENRELITFRRNKATKFLENDAEIKPANIDLETVVTVDATEDIDLQLMAVSLIVGTPKKPQAK